MSTNFSRLIPDGEALSPTANWSDVSAIPGLKELWYETLGDPLVCVAVLDGPVDLSHPSLAGADLRRLDTFDGAPADGLSAKHGTHVASTIFAGHDSPVKGIAPQCRGLMVGVFNDSEDGSVAPCSQIDLARAIASAVQFADADGARGLVINISGGQYAPSGKAHPVLADVIDRCDREKVLIVAAAGNQGCECLHIPGALPSVLAVGAMTMRGRPLDFSNWGDPYCEQGILAPGERILGASSSGTTVNSGTSFATSIVSGIAALLLSLQIKRRQKVSARAVRQGILQAALGCEHEPVADCRRLLAGRLNIPGATSIIMGTSNMPDIVESAIVDGDAMDGSVAPHVSAPAVLPADLTTPAAALPMDFAATGAQILPSDCGCGCQGKPSLVQKVYVLGKLSFDYGTRARREYFRHAMASSPPDELLGAVPDIDNHATLYRYLTQRPLVAEGNREPQYTILNGPQFARRTDVTSLKWILQIDETPVYAIEPSGAFAFEIYDTLVAFLNDQLEEGAERISVPGVLVGKTTLYTGETVPVVQPDHRGMFSWSTNVLAGAVGTAADATDEARSDLDEFLTRVYDQTRNLGLTSEDRALNYAATDALMVQGIFQDKRSDPRFRGMELDTFSVARSPVCRPDADCWDVSVIFYDPSNLQRARRGVRFTVDVSDVVPIIVGGSKKSFSLR